MLLPILVSVCAVALGASASFAPHLGGRLLAPIKTFAFLATVAVVLLHLMPEAFASLGAVGLLGLGLGAVVPEWAEGAAKRLSLRADVVGAEIGYVGLLAHHVGDGIGLSYVARETPIAALGLVAHTVPVVAVVVLQFSATRGLRNALGRALGLALAQVCGIALGNAIPGLDLVEAWTSAIVSGLLIHVIAHGLLENPPRSSGARSIDLLAAIAGVGITLGGLLAHPASEPGNGFVAQLGRVMFDVAIETAPFLLAGLLTGALVHALGRRIPGAWFGRGGALVQATRGALVSAVLPVCGCGILPIASVLHRRGAGAAFLIAFALAAPALSAEGFAVTGWFFGWTFAGLRVGVAVLVAITTAIFLALGVFRSAAPLQDLGIDGPPRGAVFSRVWSAFDELLHHAGPWVFVGIVAAAYAQVVIPDRAFEGLRFYGLDMWIVAAIALPAYASPAGVAPLAAVLMTKGVSPGAALCGLILGPSLHIETWTFLKESYGRSRALMGIGALVACAWSATIAIDRWRPIRSKIFDTDFAAHGHGIWTIAVAAVLGLLLGRSVWRSGARAWLGSLTRAGHAHTHEHADGHVHAHGHVHDGDFTHAHAHEH